MALVRVMLSNEVRLRLFPEVIDPDEVMLPAVMVMLSLAVRSDPVIATFEPLSNPLLSESVPEALAVNVIEPAEFSSELTLVVVSVMLMPPLPFFPDHLVSVLLRSCKVPMLTSSPAAIEILPEVVELSDKVFLVVVMSAAKLVKSFAAFIAIEPPLIDASCETSDLMLPLP